MKSASLNFGSDWLSFFFSIAGVCVCVRVRAQVLHTAAVRTHSFAFLYKYFHFNTFIAVFAVCVGLRNTHTHRATAPRFILLATVCNALKYLTNKIIYEKIVRQTIQTMDDIVSDIKLWIILKM